MEKVSLPGLPERRAADYMLSEFDPPRYARVIYTPQESKPDRKVIEAQAYEVRADGEFAKAPNGMPSRTPGTNHVIAMSGVGDTHTLTAGWVRVVGKYSQTPLMDQSPLPEGTQVLTQKPSSGQEGDLIYVNETLYRWDIGMVESVMRAKAQELSDLIRNSQATVDFEL